MIFWQSADPDHQHVTEQGEGWSSIWCVESWLFYLAALVLLHCLGCSEISGMEEGTTTRREKRRPSPAMFQMAPRQHSGTLLLSKILFIQPPPNPAVLTLDHV
jgi:hypothetical protein